MSRSSVDLGVDSDILGSITTVAVFLIAMFVLLIFLAEFTGLFASVIGSETTFEPQTGQFVNVEGVSSIDNETVNATTGIGVAMSGNGYVDSPSQQVGTDWTACTHVKLSQGFNNRAAYDIAAWDNETATLRYENGSWVVRRIAGGTETSVSATASNPTTWTALCGRWDNSASELAIYVNGTQNATSNLGQNTSRQVAVNLNGSLDETRLWNESLSGSDIQTYADDGVEPLPSTSHQLRLLYDEGEGSTTFAQYAGANATLVGDATWGDGLEGNGTVEGVDYETSGGEIKALQGGYLDGQPVGYLSFESGSWGPVAQSVYDVGPAALSVLVVLVLAFAANGVMRELDGFGGGR